MLLARRLSRLLPNSLQNTNHSGCSPQTIFFDQDYGVRSTALRDTVPGEVLVCLRLSGKLELVLHLGSDITGPSYRCRRTIPLAPLAMHSGLCSLGVPRTRTNLVERCAMTERDQTDQWSDKCGSFLHHSTPEMGNPLLAPFGHGFLLPPAALTALGLVLRTRTCTSYGAQR